MAPEVWNFHLKHGVSSDIKELKEVENNVLTIQKVISRKKFETAVIMFLCLVTLTFSLKTLYKKTLDSNKLFSLV